jgi:hypothetical protein
MALNEDEQTEAVFKSVRNEVDPVSGNEVPPGSLPEEVRDDIPAMLSEGEYVVPADVLRFYGVKFFEDLRAQAKMGLAEMEANGRIGGEPIEAEEDDLPFADEELMVEEDGMPSEEEMNAALGGLVGYADGGAQLDMFGNQMFQQDPDDPTQVIMGSQAGTGGYELITYYGPAGQEVNIPFFNGTPLGAIPAGYTQNKPEATSAQEVLRDDDDFDAASAARARQRIADAEKEDKGINFSNPNDVMSAVDTYYSSQGILGKAGTAMFGIPGLIGAKLIGKYEKNKLIEGIDSALADESLEEKAREKLELQKGYLEDKKAYKDYKEKEGKKYGFLDTLSDFFGISDGEFGIAQQESKFKKPDKYKTNDDWKDASLGNWVDATNLVNSISASEDPIGHHKAVLAQAQASREATAAARAASGWGTEDYKPSGPPKPTVFNSNNEEDDE